MKQTGEVVLASQSAARAAVLRDAGVAFGVRPARIDESTVKHEGVDAGTLALTLARMKAMAVGRAGQLVIGADQTLVCEGRRFDKPANAKDARAHLLALRGRMHELVTACVCVRDGEELWQHVARPRLWMREFSEDFLDEYLAQEGDRVLDCVGAYRIEGAGIQLFDRAEGERSAVLGLPMFGLLAFLRSIGLLET